MRKLKKIAALALCLIIAFGSMSALAFDISEDVKGTKYEDSAALLKALGIVSGDEGTGAMRPNDNILRSEFAKLAVNVSGLTNVADSFKGVTIFPDVVANHWGLGFINAAANQGYIIGDTTGNFRPDDNLTYAEAITLFVRVLGYEPRVSNTARWPFGHIAVADSIGLTEGISYNANAPINRGDVMMMAENALETNVLEQVYFGNVVSYQESNKVLATDKLDVKFIEGVVSANENTFLDSASSMEENQIQIGTTTLITNERQFKDMLGKTAKAYYKTQSGKNNLLMLVEADTNKEVTFSADDFKTASATELKYKLNGGEKSVSLDSSNLNVIFNGRFFDLSGKDLETDVMDNVTSGYTTLIDADGNGKYETVIVYSFENLIVDSISESTKRVYFKDGKASMLLDADKTSFVLAADNGTELELTDLAKNDVVSVARDVPGDADATLLFAIVSTDSETGPIQSIINGDEYMINGRTFKVAADSSLSIDINDNATWLINFEGKLIGKTAATEMLNNYAYLMDAAKKTSIGTDGMTVDVLLYTQDGKERLYTIKDRVNVNGVSGQKPLDAWKKITNNPSATAGGSDPAVKQLVTFEVNGDQITRMDFAVSNGGTPNTTQFNMAGFMGSKYVKATNKLGSYGIAEDTAIFIVNSGEYSIVSRKALVDGTSYVGSIYNLGSDYTVGAVVITNIPVNAIGNDEDMLVVESISTLKNSNGDTVNQIDGYMGGEKVSLMTSELGITNVAGLLKGDAITVSTNSKGEVTSVTIIYTLASLSAESDSTTGNTRLMFAKLEKKFDTSINVSVSGTVSNLNIANAKIYQIDTTSDNKVSAATMGDIIVSEVAVTRQAFIRIVDNVVTEVVIIKK